jgi:uncharacterized protein
VWLVVFDANVWVSAYAFPGSVPYQAIALARRRGVRSVTSVPLVDQVQRALQEIGTSPARIQAAGINMRQISRLVHPTIRVTIIAGKESDNRVLECADAGRANCIVTGDRKHLLPLRQYHGIPILSPRAFLDAHQRGLL